MLSIFKQKSAIPVKIIFVFKWSFFFLAMDYSKYELFTKGAIFWCQMQNSIYYWKYSRDYFAR